ncbi:MAG TPA: protein translocase subunit SecF [Acidimicrobiales bacterium]|nr:protein translocase subunit SecF [Acidimicrobiales bacterium]
MSPFEQHDDQLRDMQVGGSGQQAPEEDPLLPPSDADEPVDAGEPLAADGADGEPEDDVVGDDLQEALVEDEVEREETKAEARAGRGPGPLRRLYRGETSFDFVGRRKWWFTISAVIIVAGLASLGVRGLNLGITFRGGTAWTVLAPGVTQSQALSAVEAAGLTQPTVEVLGSGSRQQIEVQADLNDLTPKARAAEQQAVSEALTKLAGKTPKTPNVVSQTTVGPTWGSQVTQRAVIALIVFLVVVAVYISFRFEPKMALAAFIALIHDLLITAGVYSLAGFQVTPDTVIAVLTILGYSLYDTVVVFDRVRDNSRGFGASGRMTYSDMINLSMNQTLARSINTSLVAILPVLAVLLIGAELLGATTLQDYGLALTVGLISGAYSSIFIASPVLAMLKEREPRYVAIRQRLEARGERIGRLSPSAAAALVAAGAGAGGARPGAGRPPRPGKAARPGTIRPGQARANQAKAAQARAAQAKATQAKGAAATDPGVVGAGVATNGAASGAPAAGGGVTGSGPAQRSQPRPRKPGGKGGKSKRRR